MTAPDLRPECDCGACGPSVAKPEHQLEHLVRCDVVAQVVDIKGDVVAEFDSASGRFSDEPLAKVLPAGGPLQPRRDFPEWECSGCGLRSTTPSLAKCLHGHNNCPMVARP